jgi:hypothetical protein
VSKVGSGLGIDVEGREMIEAMSLLQRRIWAKPAGLPRFLYKYRPLPRTAEELPSVDLIGMKALIERNQIYYSSPLRFNDLHEGLLSYRTNSSPETVRQAFAAILNRNRMRSSEFAAIRLNPEWNPSATELRANFDLVFRRGMEQAGVFSSCASCRRPPMWAYYASDGAGVCVQIETQHDLSTFALAERVQYSPVKPSMDLMQVLVDDGLGDEILTALTTKGEAWSHENEWRLIHEAAGQTQLLSAAAVSAVIFGPRITDIGRKLVLRMLDIRRKNGLPEVKIWRAEADPSRYDLRITS